MCSECSGCSEVAALTVSGQVAWVVVAWVVTKGVGMLIELVMLAPVEK